MRRWGVHRGPGGPGGPVGVLQQVPGVPGHWGPWRPWTHRLREHQLSSSSWSAAGGEVTSSKTPCLPRILCSLPLCSLKQLQDLIRRLRSETPAKGKKTSAEWQEGRKERGEGRGERREERRKEGGERREKGGEERRGEGREEKREERREERGQRTEELTCGFVVLGPAGCSSPVVPQLV